MRDSSAANTGPSLSPARDFPVAEFERRAAAIQANMREQSVDVLWLSTEADIRYLTGFLTQFWQSPTRPWYVLLPQSGKPVAVIPTIGAECMGRTWVDDLRVWSAPHPHDDGVSLLTDTIKELAGPKANVGVPMGHETYIRSPVNDIERIKQLLPDVQWSDATMCIRSVRQIKSALEVEKLKYICAATSVAFGRIPEIIHSGMTEVDVFRAFRIACLESGADEAAYVVGAASQGGYADIISPPSNHVLIDGDILILDTGCVFDGYYSDFDRNFAVKSVDSATAAAHQRVWDATEAGLELIKPGVTCAELFATMQNVMKPGGSSAGSSDVGRLGHGLGIQLTETPSIAAFDHTPMQVGMTMTLEPGYSYAGGKLMVHEENLVVTKTGYELLSTRATRDIPIIA
ncbi:MAG: Xaa-Pro dipeptidase [Gammaproteobacteria bacterium]|jgi:Xaa-Pro dipeptidase